MHSNVLSAILGVLVSSILAIVVGCSSSGTPSDASPPGLADGEVVHTPNGDVPCAGPYTGYRCPRANRGFEITPVPLDTMHKSPDDIIRIGYGSYLVNALADCTGCHNGPTGILAGGVAFPVDRSGHVVWSRNLTPDARTGMTLSEEQFLEVMRTGKDFHKGSPGMLLMMPSMFYRWASDGDLRAIYAYLRAVPAVSNAVPEDMKSGLGLPMAIPFSGSYAAGDIARSLPLDSGALAPNLRRGLAIQPLAQPRIITDPVAFARGSYLVNSLSLCGDCHTQGQPGSLLGGFTIPTDHYLTGGTVFLVPPSLQPVLHQTRTMSSNLIGATRGFFHAPGTTFGLFSRMIATQSRADAVPPRPIGFPMPTIYQHMLPEDLYGIFVYSTSITPNRVEDVRTQDYARWCATSADCRAGETCHIGATPRIGNECVGKVCSVDADCDACQTCAGVACVAPADDSVCIANAF